MAAGPNQTTRANAKRILTLIHNYWDINRTKINGRDHPWHDEGARYRPDSRPDNTMHLCKEEVDEVIGVYSPPIAKIDVDIKVFGNELLVFTLVFHTERQIYRQHHWSIPKQCLEYTAVMLGKPTGLCHNTTYYSHPPGTAGPYPGMLHNDEIEPTPPHPPLGTLEHGEGGSA
jgi:hypothetical protein